jgi:hypothetical protein
MPDQRFIKNGANMTVVSRLALTEIHGQKPTMDHQHLNILNPSPALMCDVAYLSPMNVLGVLAQGWYIYALGIWAAPRSPVLLEISVHLGLFHFKPRIPGAGCRVPAGQRDR